SDAKHTLKRIWQTRESRNLAEEHRSLSVSPQDHGVRQSGRNTCDRCELKSDRDRIAGWIRYRNSRFNRTNLSRSTRRFRIQPKRCAWGLRRHTRLTHRDAGILE